MSGDSARLADRNLVEAVREHARWQQPSECVEDRGVLLLAGSNEAPLAFRNCAIRVDPKVPAQDVLARARAFFAPRRRGFTLIVRQALDADVSQVLQSAGIAETGAAPCMLIEAALAAPALPAGVRVERFADERHISDAVGINEDAYQAIKLPAEQTRMYFNRPRALLSPRVRGFVAYREGRPVATALTILSGDSAGVYWVGTASGAQRGGLGMLCTVLATNAGFDAGARLVTLQASAFGQPLYERLGYRTYDSMRRYRLPPPAA